MTNRHILYINTWYYIYIWYVYTVYVHNWVYNAIIVNVCMILYNGSIVPSIHAPYTSLYIIMGIPISWKPISWNDYYVCIYIYTHYTWQLNNPRASIYLYIRYIPTIFIVCIYSLHIVCINNIVGIQWGGMREMCFPLSMRDGPQLSHWDHWHFRDDNFPTTHHIS